MSGRTRTRAFLVLPRAVLTFLGISAVIVGILAMHVWMGGHGASAHGSAVPAGPVASVAGAPAGAEGAHSHSGPDHGVSSVANADPVGSALGCGGSCADEGTTLGLCILALIVVAVLAVLVPAGRLVPGAVLLRGPPRILLRPLTVPAPSLIRLCISRT